MKVKVLAVKKERVVQLELDELTERDVWAVLEYIHTTGDHYGEIQDCNPRVIIVHTHGDKDHKDFIAKVQKFVDRKRGIRG